MSIKRLFLFFVLVAMCLAAASIRVHPRTMNKYEELQKMEQNGNWDSAESGYRSLVINYPHTPAGIKSARRLIEEGTPVVDLGVKILKARIENTTKADWLFFVSAFFVITVFLKKNALPAFIFFPFILSAAGIFQLSQPLVSIDSSLFKAFLAINPGIYTALTLLIAAGYIYHRWDASGKAIYKNAFVQGTLTLAEQLLIREMYLKRLKSVQGCMGTLDTKLKTPHGRHFVSEINRLYGTIQQEHQQISGKLDTAAEQHGEMITNTREAIDRCRQESIETRILFKSKAFNRKEYKKRRKAIKSARRKQQRRMSEIRGKIAGNETIHFGNRLQFMRRDIFSSFMNEHFIDDQALFQKIIYEEILSHPQAAKENIMRRRLLYRKSSVIGGRLIKLEIRRAKLKEKVYNERLSSLANEKKILDRELVSLAGKIAEQMAICKNQYKELEPIIEDLAAEKQDLTALAKIRGCFPAHIKSRRLKIRQDIRFCKGAIPRIQQVEKIYKVSQRILLE